MKRYSLLALWLFLSYAATADPPTEIRFIENKNQWPTSVLFGANVTSGEILFLRDRIFFSFWETGADLSGKSVSSNVPHAGAIPESGYEVISRNGHAYEVLFLNANPHATVNGEDPNATKYNYLLGDDPKKWATNAASFGSLYYHDLYCDIDMRYFSHKGRMKYEWIVAPQISPAEIRMRYNGLTKLYIDNENLHLETSVNEIWEMKPFAYQIVNGEKVAVPCRYELRKDVVSYAFPQGYDECLPLIIDPILIFSGYSGSTLDNWGNTATYDNQGNVYSGGMVAGSGSQTGYPLTPGAYQTQYGGGTWDVGILKFDSAGTELLYCTYLGGSGTETPQSLVVNAEGDLLILGATSSSDFPVTNGSQFRGGEDIDPLGGVLYTGGTDIFVARLSANGDALIGSTYLGGTSNDGVNFISGSMNAPSMVESPLARNYGDQLRGDVLTDEDDFIYIASSTRSADFLGPGGGSLNTYSGGSHDAVLVKLQPDLSAVVWSRFIGGSQTDAAYSVKLDSENNVFVAGGSNSVSINGMNGFKTTNTGNIDGWILAVTNDGALINGTFLGTAQYDQVYFIDLNADDDVFAFGQTLGTYVPGKSGRQFVHKLSHDLAASSWATVIGPGTISPTAFLVSDCGYIYLSGWGGAVNATSVILINGTIITRNYIGGNTNGLPVTTDAYQSTTSGDDFYLLVLSEDGTEHLYATFLGGNQSATHVDGGTSRFDKKGIVYHAVCAGCGGYSDFPAINVPSAYRMNRSNKKCNNAVFKFDLSLLKARLQTNSVKFDSPGLNNVCLEDPIVFQNLSSGGETFEWDLGDGTRLTRRDKGPITHTYQQTGRYLVWLKAIDKGTCQVKDSVSKFIDVYDIDAFVQNDDVICEGDSYQLKSGGADQYEWFLDDGTIISNQPNPVVTPVEDTKYYVRLTAHGKCVHLDSVTVGVIDKIVPDFEILRIGNCEGLPSVRVRNTTADQRDADQIFFDFGNGSSSDKEEELYQYPEGGDYVIKLVGVRNICVTEKSVTMTIQPLVVPNVITPRVSEGLNDVFFIEIGEGTGKSPADIGVKVSLNIYNRWGRPVYSNEDYQNNWDGAGLPSGVYYYDVTVGDYGTCRSWVHVIR